MGPAILEAISGAARTRPEKGEALPARGDSATTTTTAHTLFTMAKKPVILMGGGFTGGGKSAECEAKVMAKYGGE